MQISGCCSYGEREREGERKREREERQKGTERGGREVREEKKYIIMRM